MKAVHWLSLASLLFALAALFAGQPQWAAWITGLAVLIELLAAILTGKKTNDQTH